MYTLPDVFTLCPPTNFVLRHRILLIKSQLEKNEYNMTEKEWSDEKFWPSIMADFDADALNRKCNKLRNSSKYIGTRFADDGTVTHVLKCNTPLAASIAIIVLPMFTVSFLYFPVLQGLHRPAYGSTALKPAKHVQSRAPVPATGPKELAVHALHVVLRLKPVL